MNNLNQSENKMRKILKWGTKKSYFQLTYIAYYEVSKFCVMNSVWTFVQWKNS